MEETPNLTPQDNQPVIILVSEINPAVLQAIKDARSISADILALHIALNAEAAAALRVSWEQTAQELPLIMLPAAGRSIAPPITGYIDALLEQYSAVTVFIAETDNSGWTHRLRQLWTTSSIRHSLKERKNITVNSIHAN